MTAAKRTAAASVAILVVLAGSGQRPDTARAFRSANTTVAAAHLEAQPTTPVAELVADIRLGGGSNPGRGAVLQNTLYFAADDGVHGRELWRLDASGAATLVWDIVTGTESSSPNRR